MSSINGKSKKASESDKSVRGGANDYIKRRWSVVPIPYKAKAPEIKGWQDLRISENEVDSYFKAKRQNVGVLLGEPSGWLVDVDLDCDEAVRLAPHILPPTAAVFGRAGNRSSHRLYVSPDLKTTKFQAKDDGMLLELRSTRLQTLFPPSVHPGGETIIWVKQGAPAEVDAGDLLEACEILAAAALLVRHWPDQGSRHGVALALAGAMLPAGWSVKDVKLLMEIVTTEAGDEEVDDRVRAVADTHHRLKCGQRVTGMPRLAELMGDDVVKSLAKWLGLDASVDRLVLSPAAPLESAQQFVSHAYSTGGARTIHHHQGGFYAWSGTYYPEVGLDEIRARLYSFLGEAVTLATGSDGGYAPFNPNAGKVSQVIDALKSVAHLAPDQAAPCWLDDRSKPDPYNLLACGNGLLQSRPRKLLPHTPDFFNHHALPFDFNPRAPEPVEWLNFLNSLWPKDAEAINTLQEIMGYLLTNDTRQQKIFMLVGPARSGKGTIGGCGCLADS